MDNSSIVREFFAVMSTQGPDKAAEQFCTDDFSWWTPGVGEMKDQLSGLSALIAKHFDEKGIVLTIEGVTAEGDRVAVEARSEGQLRSGPRYANQYHWLFVLRDGKIAIIKEYNDTAHVQQVLGPILAGTA